MKDPCTTFDQLKSLRLVCRSFNHVIAPRVLSCVRLFGNNPVSNIRRLHAMFSSNSNRHLHLTNTLVLSWKWRYEHFSVFVSFRTMRILNRWVYGMIWNSTIAPFVYLYVVLFLPRFLPLRACDLVARLHARYHLSQASVRNTMPNIRRVMWVSQLECRDCGYKLTILQMGRQQRSGSDGVHHSQASLRASSAV